MEVVLGLLRPEREHVAFVCPILHYKLVTRNSSTRDATIFNPSKQGHRTCYPVVDTCLVRRAPLLDLYWSFKLGLPFTIVDVLWINS